MLFARTLRRLRQSFTARQAHRLPKPIRRPFQVEHLEDRLSPACTTQLSLPQLTFNCNAANDTIEMAVTGPWVTMTINGNQSFVPVAGVGAITINAGDGNDQVRIVSSPAGAPLTINAGNHNDSIALGYGSASLGNLGSTVTANAGAGQDSIRFVDESNTVAGTYTLNGNTLSRTGTPLITYSGFNNGIELFGVNRASTYNIENTPAFSSRINPGNAADTINVKRTTSPLTIRNLNNSLDQINIGNLGNVDGIQANVDIIGPANSARVFVNDSADATADNAISLTATGLTGIAPAAISWSNGGVRTLEVRAGSGGNTVTIQDNPGGTFFGEEDVFYTGVGTDTVLIRDAGGKLSIHGQGGLDNVTVGTGNSSTPISGNLFVSNANSRTALTVNCQAVVGAQNINLSGDTLLGMVTGSGLRWAEADLRSLTLNAGLGADTISVNDTPDNPGFQGVTINAGGQEDAIRVRKTSSPLSIQAGAGNDTIDVYDQQVTLNDIRGALTVDGGSGDDTLSFSDEGQQAAHEYHLAGGMLSRDSSGLYSFSSIRTLNFRAGNGYDVFYLHDAPAGTAVDLRAGSSPSTQDFLVGPNAATTWNIGSGPSHSLSSPDVPGGATFRNFGILLGGDGDDTFRISNGQVPGLVMGGGGAHNKLDYSSHTGDVYVNLYTAEATGAGGAYNIQDVIGGAGNDVLVGDDAHNILEGRGGRDLLIAGGAGYALQPDVLTGGLGEDILIAGYTAYDYDAASLQWLRDQWAGPGSYTDRMAALSPYLNESTVFSNWAEGNLLNGGGGDLDWFFLRSGIDNHDISAGEMFAEIF